MSDRLTEIRARLAEATRLPWQTHTSRHGDLLVVGTGGDAVADIGGAEYFENPPNAALIAAAPADLEWACAEIERLTRERDGLRGELDTALAVELRLVEQAPAREDAAFRAGAEAMRSACINEYHCAGTRQPNFGLLPIPEAKR